MTLALSGPSYSGFMSRTKTRPFRAGLNGRFHGPACWTNARKTALLFKRPLWNGARLLQESKGGSISRRAKAILAVRPELRRMNHKGSESSSLWRVMEDRTLFAGLSVLPPVRLGHSRTVRSVAKRAISARKMGKSRKRSTPNPNYSSLRDRFSPNLPRYFRRPRTGRHVIDGWMDTRMIMACRNRKPDPCPVIPSAACSENHGVRVARRVAKACNQPFQGELLLARNFCAVSPLCRSAAGLPCRRCVDVSRSPGVYLE